MHARKNSDPGAHFDAKAFEQLTQVLGLKTDLEIATWVGVAESTFSRVSRGETRPGGRFMRRTMTAVTRDSRLAGHPAATYDALFPDKEPEMAS